MAKGQPSSVTQTNKVELTPEQRELMRMGMGEIDKSFANGGPQLPGVESFDPSQWAAQEGVLAKSHGMLSDMALNLANSQNFLTGDVMDMSKNPALRGAIDAAIRPITENFQNIVMPGLRTEAISAGPGALNSPKGAQRGQFAANQYLRQVGDTSDSMANEAYRTNLDAMVRGVALAPQSMQSALFPEIVQEGVGAQRRGLTQAQNAQGFNQQMLPFQLGTQLISSAAGAPGAGSTSTVQGAQPGSNWTQMLGAGLSAASMLMGMPGLG